MIDVIWPWAWVFGAMFMLDFVWAKYTRAVQAGQRCLASAHAAGIILLNGAAVLGYVGDPLLLIPAMLGAYAGTWVAIENHTVG